MKTKIKRHSRAVISVILAISMLISCMMVGLIATDAAKVTDSSVGAKDSGEEIGTDNRTIYLTHNVDDWYKKNYVIGVRYSSGTTGTVTWRTAVANDTGQTISGKHVYSATIIDDNGGVGAMYIKAYANATDANNDSNDKGNTITVYTGWTGYSNWSGKYYNGSSFVTKPAYDTYAIRNGTSGTKGANTDLVTMSFNSSTKKYTASKELQSGSTYNLYVYNNTTQDEWRIGATTWTSTSSTTLYNYGTPGNQGAANITITPTSTGTFSFEFVNKLGTIKEGNDYRADAGTFKATFPATTPLAQPEIEFNNSTVNSGDNVTLTVKNHSNYPAAANVTYELYKDDTKLTTGYSYSNGVFTIPSTTGTGTYKVKAVTTNAQYTNSSPSSGASLTVYSPQFSLLGNVGPEDIEQIVNASASHNSDAPHEWPNPEKDDDKYFKESVRVNKPTDTPGKYSIQFKVKSSEAVHIGIYQSATGQRGFSYNGTNYDTRNNDLAIPSGGIEGIDLIAGVSSMVFKPGVVYTLTIDQTQTSSGKFGKISITSDSADVNAIARYKTFNPTTGQLNDGVAYAPAAVGIATASPSFEHKPYNSTLTATVSDTSKYDFAGWYSDADCTTNVSDEAEYVAQDVNADVNYYALFTEKEPTPVNLTFDLTDGSVSNVTGTHSGSGTSYTVYPGATVTFTVAPQSNIYELKSVTATNGSVSINGNNVTISNISADTEVNVLCTKVETYSVTIAADNSTYGKYTASYTQQNGNPGSVTSTNTTQTITIKKGTYVTLTATANNNGLFDGWKVVNGTYLRSKSTPFTAKQVIVQPTSNFSIKALFEKGISPSGSQESTYYHIKVANSKETTYTTNVPLYYTKVGDYNEFRSYFTIGDTDQPDQGKLKVGKDYWFILSKDSGSTDFKNNHYNAEIDLSKNPSSGWYTSCETSNYNDNGNNMHYIHVKFNDTAKTATVFWGKRKEGSAWADAYFDKTAGDNNSKYGVNFTVTTSSGTNTPTDDIPSLTGMNNLYVLDGIVTRNSGNIQDFGTNKFGDSKIISAKSGVVTYNYFNAQGDEKYVMTDNTHSEGQTQYHYNPKTDLDFRVQTTIAANHQAIGVRAYVMNGITYPAKKDKNGKYYADITLDANSGEGTLEVIPVYYNTLIPEKDYIKFYVDANTIGDTWGKTIGYSIWYKNDKEHGMEGGYPGQPLLSDGNKLYGYFPRYYVGVNATTLPTEASKNKFAGVLLTNLAEHNYTHQDVLKDWSVTAYNKNYQTFDYEDPVKIADIPNVDTIEFVAKYEESNTNHQTGTHFVTNYSKNNALNGAASSTFPSGITKPASASDLKGFEILTDIDGNPVDIYNNKLESGANFNNAVYVVSVGNQIVTPNQWDTVWMVYSNDQTPAFITAKNPAEFINVAAASQQNNLKGKTVYINYEKFLDGDAKSGISNSGDRIDGRWLYSKSTDPTTIRLRVATEDGGNLTFHNEFLDWAEVSNGEINGAKETGLPEGVFDTKRLNLPNRTTEVTAKINPIGYEVTGMYMLSAKYTSTADNGYSSKKSDYDDLDVTGTATSFTNTRDNRMVIIVKEIPATDLLITHQMYGGPGAHKIKGFYYVKAELIDSNDDVVKTYGVDNDYTNKPLMIKNFTTDAPKDGNYKLKVYIKTAMSGAATFNQWYENDPETVYNALPSDDARGSSDPVVYEKVIDVAKDLYKTNANNLLVNNLDYYSDLQSADSVNINHTLIQSTVDAGFTGSTYNKVTVVDSSGNTIAGGDLAARARTTTVDTNFITQDNASNGSQLKIEIWTVPAEPAKFDKFYKSNQTEMTTGSTDGIYYHTGETTTIGGVTYEKATVMVPISYFFKDGYDEQGGSIKVFDPAKKDFNLYSSLKVGYKYSLTFDFQGYRNLYGNLGYDYAEQEFTVDELNKYFKLSDSVTDTNGHTVTAYTFKDNDAREAFINLKAPYENTFMETVKWQTDMYEAGVHDEGMTANYDSTSHTWSFVVKLKKTDNRFAFATFRFPYQVQQYTDNHAPKTSTVTIDGKSVDAVVKLTNDGYVEYGGRNNTTTNYRTGYGATYIINKSGYVTAAQQVWNSTDSRWEYFDYWKVENVGNDKTGSAEYTRCYYPEFNLSLYQDSIITPVYSTAAQGTSPSQRAARDDNARTDTYSTKGRATITLMENSRMQWTGGRSGNTLTGNYVNGGDRIYTDFLVSYTYQDLQLNTDTTGMNAGVVIETVRDLDSENDEYVTKTQDEYKTSDDSSINKSAVEAYIKNGTGSSFLKTEFSVTTLDNKNRKNQYYSLPNISQTSHNPTVRKNKLYRAYSYLKDKDGNVLLISDPIYFTIYDIASIENMSAGAEYGGVS